MNNNIIENSYHYTIILYYVVKYCVWLLWMGATARLIFSIEAAGQITPQRGGRGGSMIRCGNFCVRLYSMPPTAGTAASSRFLGSRQKAAAAIDAAMVWLTAADETKNCYTVMRTPAADRAGYGVPVLRQKEHTVKKDMPPVLAPMLTEHATPMPTEYAIPGMRRRTDCGSRREGENQYAIIQNECFV